ncbi:hypothetical protein C8R44DRAFT_723803 [Mycena epipterygia]|nr:hypothetical protein C8R44DRAFT_723803 [Mycena epipterygia]
MHRILSPAIIPFTSATTEHSQVLGCKYLGTRDLLMKAKTCKFHHKLANDIIEENTNHLFTSRDLSWDITRWMLTNTDSLVTSLTAYRDMYPFTIAVHACAGENPRATVIRQPWAILHNWYCGQGWFTVYQHFTCLAITFPNKEYIELDEKQDFAKLREEKSSLEAHRICCIPFHNNAHPGNQNCGKKRSQHIGINWALGIAGCNIHGPEFFVHTFNLEQIDSMNEWNTRYEGIVL